MTEQMTEQTPQTPPPLHAPVMRAQTVATQIRRAVSAGDYSPGDKLNEVTVAESLEVSRNTLREAFAMLAADGIIERFPHRGVFIASPTVATVADLFRARAVMEPAALLWGAPDLTTLDTIVSEAENAIAAENHAATGLANQRFHRALVASVGSSLLDEEMERLLAIMRLVFLSAESSDPGFHRRFVPVNRHIITLLRTGDRTAAAENLHTALEETGQELCSQLS